MTDATDLRATLNRTDSTAPAIQSSSRAIMRFYDRPGGAEAAVSEWRSALQSCSPSKSLPLLYVANEVLQTSKRNRGNRFLEAFSPVLGSSLQFICERDRTVVEKVRRTVKIWGDRRIFSLRFVMEVLGGLDPYREGAAAAPPASSPPAVAESLSKLGSPSATPNRSSQTVDSDDEDDNLFGVGGEGQKLLDISIDAKALSAAVRRPGQDVAESVVGAKRRRSSAASASPLVDSIPVAKRAKALSGQNFLDLFKSVVALDEQYRSSMGVVDSIPPSYLDDGGADVDDMVGDELTEMYRRVCQAQRNIRRERRAVYSVAVHRRDSEKEARRYVSWLKNLASVDDDDIMLCDKLEKKIDTIAVFHEEAKALRDARRAEEARSRAEAEAAKRREAEEEERRRILDDAKMEAEAKPGMVWNKELREYQYVHDPTEESWRD